MYVIKITEQPGKRRQEFLNCQNGLLLAELIVENSTHKDTGQQKKNKSQRHYQREQHLRGATFAANVKSAESF